MTSRSTALLVATLACIQSFNSNVEAFGVVTRHATTSSSTTALAVKKVKFQDDGGIMMELFSPIPKKNPTPQSMLPREKPAEFKPEAENGIMMKEANLKDVTASKPAGQVLSIPPETAEKIQTTGQKFATYTSDGGLMYQAALKKRNVIKSTPKEPEEGDKTLESSPTGAQSATGRGRILIPPSLENGEKAMVWKQREIDFLPAGSG
eukprot:CAMPEP_0113487646 /NCGR_PEP_ID=MMETSP0014_2-20120614/25613_1 /TAXON_ID=2857 /ORGANISM="Nitzschia sp." /LENGTH=206 /DNA_ID=CAMNT_0000381343 /DNA_START=181 /DNA_END=801 /DNA_ORIENTATION=- /assembly_acc=CAM_ASM_000159